MAIPDPHTAANRAAADSVFRFLARTAESAHAGVWWPVPAEAGAPQGRGDLYGNGGIPLFLAAYHRRTGDPRALELATRSVAWCAASDRPFLGDLIAGSDPWSLLDGRAGLGLAWLALADAGVAGATERAAALGAALAARDPGPVTGLGMGAAGKGLVLLRLWQRTRAAGLLAGAERCADWLAAHAVRDGAGCRWPFRAGPGDEPEAHTSLSHGAAGVGYFLLRLHQATGHGGYAALARAAATLVRAARPDRGGVNWLPVLEAATDLDADWKPVPVGARVRRCQWCTGAPGIGLFLATAFEVLGDGASRAAAEAAGEATWAYGDGRANPTYCHGLAGSTELLLELHRVTGRAPWLDRARDFARRMRAYRLATPAGEAWPSDAPPQPAPDLLWGAAGVGHVFLRVLDPEAVPMAFL